ncbi:hypothetical protein [Lysinibacillus sp. UBA5990]|uniref:hypothetical protein n=1 Tax=Lysinibacillus sp. UBA5990 TaxID=1946773 RepID=UPI0004D767B2|nr:MULTISPECIES: hypothetical protein [Lysinibacillus]KEK09313.1 hypothetical protein EP18_24240 [Lysinibacillus sphaericus]
MKKLLYIGALSTLLLAGCSEEKAKEDTSTSDHVETTENELAIDMTIANDKNIPLEERIAKIATDLFGTTTTDGSERNIIVEGMGDYYYLSMMNDDAITKKKAIDYAQQNTVELIRVLKGVEDLSNIRINWQANFKDAYGNINPGSAMTVLLKKGDFDKIDVANFKASDLKEIATYYHAT